MDITDYLILPQGAKKKKKRCGRGDASGHGGTSCRGHKGQKARGKTKRAKGFEGGQMPLLRRIPKRGFVSKFRRVYQIVNIKSLRSYPSEGGVTLDFLKEKGLIKNKRGPVKILGDGKLQKKVDVYAHAFSRRAKEAIEALGGKAVVVKDSV